MQHRYTSLEEVERRRSNYSDGVQKFLSTRVAGEEALAAQTLADHLETDAAYEAAVEDYLNDPLQYILVGGLDDAVRSAARVKRIGAGKCTFMTLRNGHTRHAPAARPMLAGEGIVGYLDELLRMREDVKEAFERVLPEFAGDRHGVRPAHGLSGRRNPFGYELPDLDRRGLFAERDALRGRGKKIDGGFPRLEARKTRTGARPDIPARQNRARADRRLPA